MNQKELIDIPVGRLIPNPGQARKLFDEAKLNELADSIALHGILNPLIVTPDPSAECYRIIAGERRWRAAQIIGKDSLPCEVRRDLTEQQIAVIGTIDNLQREDLTPGERAAAYDQLILQFGYSDTTLAAELNMKPAEIASARALMVLPEDVRLLITDGEANGLPLHLAQMLVKVGQVLPAKKISAAAAALTKTDMAWREKTNGLTRDLLSENLPKLLDEDRGGWELTWPKKPIAVTGAEGALNLLPCKTCADRINSPWGDFCARPVCFEAKREYIANERLIAASVKLKVTIAQDGEQLTPIHFGYGGNESAAARTLLKAGDPNLRLARQDDGARSDYYAEQLLGRGLQLLTLDADAFQTAVNREKRGGSKPKIDKSTATPAEIEKAQAATRKQKAQANREAADVAWLLSHVASLVSPQWKVTGPALGLMHDYITQHQAREDSFLDNNWGDATLILEANAEARKKAAPEAGSAKGFVTLERLQREDILLYLLRGELRQNCSWAEAQTRTQKLIEHPISDKRKTTGYNTGSWGNITWSNGLGLSLSKGWNKPPIHKTDHNCWKCGRFTSSGRVTKRDQSEGWSIDRDAKEVVTSVLCGDCAPINLLAKAKAKTAPKKTKRTKAEIAAQQNKSAIATRKAAKAKGVKPRSQRAKRNTDGQLVETASGDFIDPTAEEEQGDGE